MGFLLLSVNIMEDSANELDGMPSNCIQLEEKEVGDDDDVDEE